MKAITKIVAVATVCALAFGMVGCAGGSKSKQTTTNADEAVTHTSEDIKAQDITVVASGYTQSTSETIDADGNTVENPIIEFAFTAKNPNSGYVAQNVPFNVNGYNSNGDVVFSGGATCMYIYPGIETAVSGTTAITASEGVDTKVTAFTVEPLMATVDWLDTSLSDTEIADMFTVNDVTAERNDGTVNISATVLGDLADADKIYKIANLENTLEGHCVVIFYNAEGDIVFGSDSTNVLIDQNTLDNAKANGDSAPISNVSISIPNAPEYSTYNMFVMPSL